MHFYFTNLTQIKLNLLHYFNLHRYRGCHFGSLTGGRTKFRGKEGPGPSEYQSNSPQELIVTLQEDRPSRPTTNTTISRLPRYHDIVALDNEKKAIPSPAAYNMPSQFEMVRH